MTTVRARDRELLNLERRSLAIRTLYAFGDWPPATHPVVCPRCHIRHVGDCDELALRAAWGDA